MDSSDASGIYYDESVLDQSVTIEECTLSDYGDDEVDLVYVAGPSVKPQSSITSQISCNLVKTSAIGSKSRRENSCVHRRRFSQLISFCKLTEDKLRYFTGFEENEFKLLFDVVTIPAGFKACTEDQVDKRDQFLLTLIKLRINFDELCLAHFFNIKEDFVNQIVEHWVHRMYIALKGVDFWVLHEKQPGQYDVVIGCIEIPAASTMNVDTRSSRSSSSSQQNSFKALIGVRESGAVVYCSSICGGVTPVREILIDSDFLNHLKEGQHILADQSFNVSDILESKKVSLNIPSLKHVDRLTPEQAAVVQRIAERRKIVDKVVSSAKEFQILNKPIPTRLWPICEEILFVIVNVMNFKTNLIEASSKE